MTKTKELQDTITTELTAFYEDRHMDNPAREANLFVSSLVDLVRAEVNIDKQEAWVIALQEGYHWRFIGVPTHNKEQADRGHDPYSEFVVRILFDGPKPKEGK